METRGRLSLYPGSDNTTKSEERKDSSRREGRKKPLLTPSGGQKRLRPPLGKDLSLRRDKGGSNTAEKGRLLLHISGYRKRCPKNNPQEKMWMLLRKRQSPNVKRTARRGIPSAIKELIFASIRSVCFLGMRNKGGPSGREGRGQNKRIFREEIFLLGATAFAGSQYKKEEQHQGALHQRESSWGAYIPSEEYSQFSQK